MGSLRKYIKIARPDHWVKNVFVIPGLVFAIFLTDEYLEVRHTGVILLGMLATCLIASANYVINEWLDADFDRFHPVKKKRVIVEEGIHSKFVLLEYVLLSLAGLLISYTISALFFITEFSLLLMGILYNVKPIRTKDIPYLDVLSESVNNAIRLLLGWFMVTNRFLPPSSLILGYWMGGAFLMAIKRYAEYRMIGNAQIAASYRKSFQHYNESSLLVSSMFYALMSVFFMGIFLIKYRVEFIIVIPFLCGLYCLYLYIGYKEDSAVQKPEKLYRERGLILYSLFLVILTAVLFYVDIPQLSILSEIKLIQYRGAI